MKQALGVLEADEIYVMLMGANGNNQRNAASALRQAIEQAEQWDTSDMAHRSGGLSVEQEKMCVDCGKPTMHMGNKCYGCCQTAQPEQAEKQKPVAYYWRDTKSCYWIADIPLEDLANLDVSPLYTAPPKREWVGLTDEEIAQTVGSPLDEVYLADFRRVIAKLKERNT